MVNVSTRPPKGKTAPASTADTAAAPIEDERSRSREAINATAFAQLADILRLASNTDEAEQYTGNSDRLLRIAADMAAHAHAHRGDAVNFGFDIAALVGAALQVPGDVASEERLRRIASTKPLLRWLTEADDVLKDVPSAPVEHEGLNAEQLRRVLEVITDRCTSLNDLLIQAQGADTEGEAFVSLNAAQALAVYIGGMADGASGICIRGADSWNFGPEFARLGKAVEA